MKNIISSFTEFREEVVTKRTVFDLNKARNKAHILVGLVVANENIDKIIIRTPNNSISLLVTKFDVFSNIFFISITMNQINHFVSFYNSC